MSMILKPVSISGLQPPQLQALPPLSLYIHIPWCLKKCPYCDFNSHALRHEHATEQEEEYVAALIRDLETALPDIWGRRVYSIFLGGGTPSLFSAKSIDTLLTAIRALLPLEPFAEVTLEANPGTFEIEKFSGFRAAGVNRLSIGIQSFDARLLQSLGRVHDAMEAHRAVEIAQQYFDNINLDLMYALPGQTVDEAVRDMKIACSYTVPHISAYHLTLEPNTLFYRYPPQLPDDEQAAQMQEQIERIAADHHYTNYETSAFAKQGRESRHNSNYWLFGDYLGIGAGAHSKISFSDRIIRQMRYKNPREYLQKFRSAESPVQTQQTLSRTERGFEFMMNALRLTGGFETVVFQERTGLSITEIRKPLDEAEERGLLTRDHRQIVPTEMGKRFLNDLLQIFLPEAKP